MKSSLAVCVIGIMMLYLVSTVKPEGVCNGGHHRNPSMQCKANECCFMEPLKENELPWEKNGTCKDRIAIGNGTKGTPCTPLHKGHHGRGGHRRPRGRGRTNGPPFGGRGVRQGPLPRGQEGFGGPPGGEPPFEGRGRTRGPASGGQEGFGGPPGGEPPFEGRGRPRGPASGGQEGFGGPPGGEPPFEGKGRPRGPPPGEQEGFEGQEGSGGQERSREPWRSGRQGRPRGHHRGNEMCGCQWDLNLICSEKGICEEDVGQIDERDSAENGDGPGAGENRQGGPGAGGGRQGEPNNEGGWPGEPSNGGGREDGPNPGGESSAQGGS